MQDALEHRVRLARALPARARCESLAQALLASVDGEERRRLAIELLELAIPPGVGARPGPWERLWATRRRSLADEALRRASLAWEVLPLDTRSHLAGVGQGRWPAQAETLFSSSDAGGQSAACGLAEATGDPALVERLPALLESAHEGVRAGASEALLRLTAFALELDPASLSPDLAEPGVERHDDGAQGWGAGALCALEPAELVPCVGGAIRRALDRYQDHQLRGIALAGLLLIALRPSSLRLATARRDDPAAQAVRGVLRFSRSPASRLCAWRLLVSSNLGEAARDRVARAHTLADHEAVLTHGHLALHPSRAASLAMIPVRARATPLPAEGARPAMVRLTMAREAPLPDGSWVESLSLDARRQLARVTLAFRPDDATVRAVLDPMLADEDPIARLGAMGASGEGTLLDFCFDPSEAIARSAIVRWSLAGAAHFATAAVRRRQIDMLGKLTRSPHGSVRRVAREDLRRLDPFLGEDPACAAIARRRCADDREAFLVDLRHVLMSGTGEARLCAIRLARRLGIVREIESLLVAMVTHGTSAGAQERPLATAVIALGDLDSVPARQTVRWALRHADARVRANAVEALGRQESRAGVQGSALGSSRQVLMELKADAHARVRANAIAALMHDREEQRDGLYAPTTGSALIAMLRDERAEHRASALWLAGRVLLGISASGDTPLLTHVQTLASSDHEAAIRRRAARVIQRIHARRTLNTSSRGEGASDILVGRKQAGSGTKAEDQRC